MYKYLLFTFIPTLFYHLSTPVLPLLLPEQPMLHLSMPSCCYDPLILSSTICVATGLEHLLELTGLVSEEDLSIFQNPLATSSSVERVRAL